MAYASVAETHVAHIHRVAVEILRGSQDHTPKADIYSYAMLLFEILTGTAPYAEQIAGQAWFNSTLETQIVEGLRPRLPADMAPSAAKLLRACWDAEPAKRPNATELVSTLDEVCFDMLKKRFKH